MKRTRESKGKVADEERVRFCDSCNAVIGWYASYCEECGLATGDEGDGGGDARPAHADAGSVVPQVQRDLFKAHMRLIHRFHERSVELEKHVAVLNRKIAKEESQPATAESEQRLLMLAETVIDHEQEWDDVQRAYNTGSESIEEDFLSRIDEMEADLELPPDLQHAVNEEVVGFVRLLEKLESALAEAGRRVEVARQRQRRTRLFGLAMTPHRAWATLSGVAVGLWALGLGWSFVDAGSLQVPVLIALAPALVGIVLLSSFARPR